MFDINFEHKGISELEISGEYFFFACLGYPVL